jgi:hypothetical protein
MALPSLRGVGPGNTGTGTGAIVVTLPTHVTGDLLVVQIDQNTNATFSGITTGWVALRAAQASGTVLTQALYYKVATSSSETNPSFTPSKTLTWSARSAAFVGADTITSIAVPNSGTGGTSGTSLGYGTLTAPNQPNCLHVFCVGQLAGTNGTLSPPAGFTEQYEWPNGTTVKSWMATRDALVGPTAPAAATATSSVSVRWVAQSYVLRSTEYATFRSAGTATSAASASNVTPALPAGWQANDIFLLALHLQSSATPSTPSGWTKFLDEQNQSDHRVTYYWRRAVGGDTAPTISWTPAAIRTAFIMCYYRAPTSGDPIHLTTTLATSASAQTLATGSGTTTQTNTTLLGAFQQFNAAAGGWSSSTTSVLERADVIKQAAYDLILPAAGATGTISGTTTAAAESMSALLIALLSTASVESGAPPITGTAAVTVANPSVAASGTETFTGTAAPPVTPVTVAASGTETFTGTAAVAVTPVSVAATGTTGQTFTGTAAVGVTPTTVAATGAQIFTGTAAVTVPAVAVSATGTYTPQAITGTAAVTLPAVSVAATGAEVFTGAAAVQVTPVTVAATGTYTPVPISGTAAVVITTVTVSSSGSTGDVIAGTAAVTLTAVSVASTGAEVFSGTAAVVLTQVTVSGTGAETFSGAAVVALVVTVSGTGAYTPAPVSGTGAATLLVLVSGTGTGGEVAPQKGSVHAGVALAHSSVGGPALVGSVRGGAGQSGI